MSGTILFIYNPPPELQNIHERLQMYHPEFQRLTSAVGGNGPDIFRRSAEMIENYKNSQNPQQVSYGNQIPQVNFSPMEYHHPVVTQPNQMQTGILNQVQDQGIHQTPPNPNISQTSQNTPVFHSANNHSTPCSGTPLNKPVNEISPDSGTNIQFLNSNDQSTTNSGYEIEASAMAVIQSAKQNSSPKN